jgi:DNA-binding transcriptional MerR regulator
VATVVEMTGTDSPTDAPAIRIGELARRAGIPAATLRAWERRYGVVRPQRTEGGYRLYTSDDERRLRKMVDLISHGLAPAEAAREATRADDEPAAAPAEARSVATPSDVAPQALRDELVRAVRALDEAGTHRILDRALAAYGASGLVERVVLPSLRGIGELWQEGDLSVAQEHFGSEVIRSRLQALARESGGRGAPRIVLACPPGESHDLPLSALGLMLHDGGYPVAMLGTDTPVSTLADACEQLGAKAAVLALTDAKAAERLGAQGELGVGCPVLIGGPAASPELAERLGAELLPPSIPDAARRLAAAA